MKVLIAEDDPISRLLEAGAYALVVSDWMMPEMDGPELVCRIRACPRPGYVYVILLTSRAEKADVVAGMEAGADDFVTKPFDREELRVRLRAGERIVQLEHTLAEQNQALREAQAALVEQEKLASLGRVAAGLAHEINNPVAYVTNNLVVLRRDMQAALAALDAYRQGNPAEAARLEEEGDVAYFQENFA